MKQNPTFEPYKIQSQTACDSTGERTPFGACVRDKVHIHHYDKLARKRTGLGKYPLLQRTNSSNSEYKTQFAFIKKISEVSFTERERLFKKNSSVAELLETSRTPTASKLILASREVNITINVPQGKYMKESQYERQALKAKKVLLRIVKRRLALGFQKIKEVRLWTETSWSILPSPQRAIYNYDRLPALAEAVDYVYRLRVQNYLVEGFTKIAFEFKKDRENVEKINRRIKKKFLHRFYQNLEFQRKQKTLRENFEIKAIKGVFLLLKKQKKQQQRKRNILEDRKRTQGNEACGNETSRSIQKIDRLIGMIRNSNEESRRVKSKTIQETDDNSKLITELAQKLKKLEEQTRTTKEHVTNVSINRTEAQKGREYEETDKLHGRSRLLTSQSDFYQTDDEILSERAVNYSMHVRGQPMPASTHSSGYCYCHNPYLRTPLDVRQFNHSSLHPAIHEHHSCYMNPYRNKPREYEVVMVQETTFRPVLMEKKVVDDKRKLIQSSFVNQHQRSSFHQTRPQMAPSPIPVPEPRRRVNTMNYHLNPYLNRP